MKFKKIYISKIYIKINKIKNIKKSGGEEGVRSPVIVLLSGVVPETSDWWRWSSGQPTPRLTAPDGIRALQTTAACPLATDARSLILHS